MATIVNELNKLAEKITGTNPKATTDKKALDFIADYYAQEDLTPTTNAQAINNITTNYSSGGIDTSDATATKNDIISGKTAYAKGEKVVGIHQDLDTSDATATEEDILKDKTAYVNGVKITGTYESSGGGDLPTDIQSFLTANGLYLFGFKIYGGPGGKTLADDTFRNLLVYNSSNGLIVRKNDGISPGFYFLKYISQSGNDYTFYAYDLSTGTHTLNIVYNSTYSSTSETQV